MNGTVVHYPVTVKKYDVAVERSQVEIELSGVEGLVDASGGFVASGDLRRVGRITFVADDRKPFINRGGFLQIYRDPDMLDATFNLLRNENPLYVLDDGTLSTTTTSFEAF